MRKKVDGDNVFFLSLLSSSFFIFSLSEDEKNEENRKKGERKNRERKERERTLINIHQECTFSSCEPMRENENKKKEEE